MGMVFSVAWLVVSFSWLVIAMNVYGGMPEILSWLALIALSFFLSIYYGIAAYLYVILKPDSALIKCLLFAALWGIAELARGIIFTGFGWAGIGYVQLDGPLSTLLPWIGVYGVAAFAAFGAAIVDQWRVLQWKSIALAVSGFALIFILNGWEFTRSTGLLTITLLQGNIPQEEKFESNSGVPKALEWYGENLMNAGSDLIVAPETAIPLLPNDLPVGYIDRLREKFRVGSSAAMFGIPLGNREYGYTNSMVGLVPGRDEVWRYDKQHLVPFGEFIPPMFKWFTRMMQIPLGDFERGKINQPSILWAGQSIGATICYEDLFGEELAPRLLQDDAPTIFVNASNLAWYGSSKAMDQHLQISRVRAIELGRPFVRATNTGVTAIIDHHGNVHESLPREQQGVLVGVIDGRTGMTPYGWWLSRFGLWPLWCIFLGVIWICRRGVRPSEAC
jgi:apolipoprotein N-acyltransferase